MTAEAGGGDDDPHLSPTDDDPKTGLGIAVADSLDDGKSDA